MERGLYIAASGMLSEMQRQDLIANDLANASTPGYKADRTAQHSFAEMLLANRRTGATIGSLGTGVSIAGQVTDLAPQALRETGEPLDFAITGAGFFGVQTPDGLRFTRNGRFMADGSGRLTDQLGNPVVGRGGGPVTVAADGTVDPRQLGVFDVPNARKAGDGLFTGAAGGPAEASVRSGALEGSGVDAARTMVDMIASLRAFEAGQRVITTIDSTLQKAANDVGRV
ncbi:MAG TPA: flagellar hook-basal body protein [Solirubrobacteraceae bacterium]|jgi:flagellar basal-body rod protein FlgG|nr:flagellar hook-basal body protein [Solirubrobacteraceae bacterium]